MHLAKKEYGTGLHIWDLPISWATPNRLLTWSSEWCYVLASSSIKISILLFYKRLSQPFPVAFRVATWIGILYNIGYALGFGLTLGLICRPVDAYWNQFSPQWQKAGNTFHCGKEEISLPISGVLSVIGDFYSTVLPLALVWHLKLPRGKKLALYTLFALGFLVVVAGVIRTILLNVVINRTWDPLWELDTMWIWTIVELNLAIVAASAPALKSFFQHCLIRPTASLYKRTRTPSGTTSGERDVYRMESGDLCECGEKEDKAVKIEDIGRAV
ncbi:hypothetical protein EPUS_04133 [Endocarpon pusillum Z07020]|uniref:Rhodopsin domain-containing protein n=1 Tax=Endocarpon pusillum (strain Z07020 / HMAS-L-300199) TaxID=1263415 RepID=U1GW11_ENDPU|nr:uncharacterized protein EPUS_04133 [Endocarpon pusillum Z07020]ERF76276.1 hypothetical protein EPUS_04133 [Endocarpon pusillum Z07020]